MPYELIFLDTFDKSLKAFNKKTRGRILEKAESILSIYPYRYPMLKSPYTISGVKVVGLRRFKSGVAGIKGGAYVLYRICEECKENKYHSRSDISCDFCDDEKGEHIVVFIARARSMGY